jgi:hypothetical protein|tara:strand:- start:40 stop:471 length:432 start_codon:yes stop_codon:yes gene_type:complete
MKAVDFAKILKEIIKKEVRTVIREELKEALKTNKQPVRDIQSTTHAPVTQKPIPKTGNTSLDGILAETANAMRSGLSAPIGDDGAYPDMASQFTADQAQGFGHMMQDTMPAVNPNDPTSAFVKDYSQVLKSATAIHDKKYNRG